MRDVRISFKLNRDKHEQLKRAAEETGITMSAYLAYVIGEHLRVKAQAEPIFINSMIEDSKNLLKEQE